MKKIAALALALMMVLSVCSYAESLLGGWTLLSSMSDYNEEGYENAYAAYDKAMETYEGDEMILAEALCTKVVAGTNYCYLTQTVDHEDSAPLGWNIAVVYVDLSGNASVTDLYSIGKESVGAIGGWFVCDDMNEENMELIENALSTVDDPTVLPYSFIVLNQQIVSGMNYELLCQYAVIEEGSDEPTAEGFAMTVVYIDLQHNATLTEFTPFEIPRQQ